MTKRPNYEEMICADVLTERAILTVKAALNNGRFAPLWSWPCRPITDEQTVKGLSWLRKNMGRKCCKALVAADKMCLDSEFRCFTFDGFHAHGAGFRAWYEPIYTVHAKDGHWFSYSYVCGEVIVHGRG